MTGEANGRAGVGAGACRVERFGQSDPPTLAADLLLVVTDSATGRLRVHPRTAGFALAGAWLVDLALTGRITASQGRLAIAGDRFLPADDCLRLVLGWLLVNPGEVTVRAWVEALAPRALDLVTRQLIGSGWFRQVDRRSRSSAVYFEPTDRQRVYWQSYRLVRALVASPQLADIGLFLLVDAAGFTPPLLAEAMTDLSRERRQTLFDAMRSQVPGVVEIAAVVRALVDRVALAPH